MAKRNPALKITNIKFEPDWHINNTLVNVIVTFNGVLTLKDFRILDVDDGKIAVGYPRGDWEPEIVNINNKRVKNSIEKKILDSYQDYIKKIQENHNRR